MTEEQTPELLDKVHKPSKLFWFFFIWYLFYMLILVCMSIFVMPTLADSYKKLELSSVLVTIFNIFQYVSLPLTGLLGFLGYKLLKYLDTLPSRLALTMTGISIILFGPCILFGAYSLIMYLPLFEAYDGLIS